MTFSLLKKTSSAYNCFKITSRWQEKNTQPVTLSEDMHATGVKLCHLKALPWHPSTTAWQQIFVNFLQASSKMLQNIAPSPDSLPSGGVCWLVNNRSVQQNYFKITINSIIESPRSEKTSKIIQSKIKLVINQKAANDIQAENENLGERRSIPYPHFLPALCTQVTLISNL